MDIATKPGAILSSDDSNKGFLYDVTIVNATAGKHIVASAQRGGSALSRAKTRKENTYRGSYDSATYTLVTLAFSTCGDIGADTIDFIKQLAYHRVAKRGGEVDEHEMAAAQGQEGAELRRRFSFVLQRALSQRTRIAMAKAHALPPGGPAVALAAAWSSATKRRAEIAATARHAVAAAAAAMAAEEHGDGGRRKR